MAKQIIKITEEHRKYLDSLRRSGKYNMYAVTPNIQKKFSLDRDRARSVLMQWMQRYSHS
jgi:hypothetical protein